MAGTYYDSSFQTGQEIDAILTAVNTLRVAANNGKVVVIQSGELAAVDPATLFDDADETAY